MSPTISVACKALNHLIAQEPWAQKLLFQHQAKVIMVDTPIREVYLQIFDGFLSPYPVEHSSEIQEKELDQEIIQPSVTFTISQSALWAYMSGGKIAALKHIKIAGDVDLAADLNRLANDLHWEVEEDLSKILGDALSTKVTKASKQFLQNGQSAFKDLQTNIKAYLVNEKNVLVDQQHFTNYKAEIRVLRDDIDRMEKRIERLMQQWSQKSTL
jgi:ubiquinone biosynthesis protein UbiJ